MAIYHLSMKIISRGNGQNAVASAAYRSGEKLLDEQDGTEKFYDRSVLPETHILAPSNAPSWVYNRQELWNNVERCEKRVNSQLARELEIALPLELSDKQQTELIKEFIQENCVDKGMIADIGIHRDHPENPHAHVMLTMREINKNGFGEKNRGWNHVTYLEHTRKRWAEVCNKYLENVNSMERIDHRSYKEQGVDLIPTEHVGVTGKVAEKNEYELESKVLQRNAVAKAYNQKVIDLQEKRDQLLNEGLSEQTENPNNLVVTYRMYMTNQRELRIAYNKVNFYESKLKKEGSLSLFEREKLSEAREAIQEIGDRKFDYIDHVNKFLRSENSIFVSFADKYGENQAQKLRDKLTSSGKKIDESMQKYIDRTATRFSEEMKIRFADTIKQLGTTDAKTIVSQVEKQMYTNTAKRLIKGWVNHENVTLEVRKLRSELEEYRQSTNANVEKKTVRLINNLASLENVKQFYETQALTTLKNKGFGELADKYNTEKAQSAIVGMYDELVKDPSIKTARDLEVRTLNNFKLRKVQNLVRGELSGINIQKRLDSLEQWRSIQEKNIDKLSKMEQTPELKKQLEEKEKGLKDTQKSIQLIHEGKRILNVRTQNYFKRNQDLLLELHGMDLNKNIPMNERMSLDFKKEANYHLFVDPAKVYDNKELLAKMYDNVLDYKEYTVEKESKNVLYRHEYSSYHAILGNLDEATRRRKELSIGIARAKDRVASQNEFLAQFEDKWTARKELESSKFTLGKTAKLDELNEWFNSNDITARSKSGALNQVKYQYNQASYQVTKYNELDQVKIPALKNMKYLTEDKAIRMVEKDFNLQAGFRYNLTMSDQRKELFVSYAEMKKNLGVDHLDTQRLESKVTTLTEQFKQSEATLKSTQELIQEKQQALDYLNRSTQKRLNSFNESLTSNPESFKEMKGNIQSLKAFRKTELSRMESQITELRTQEKVQREQAQTKRQMVGLARNFKNVLSSYGSQVSEAEINMARKHRMKALQKEQGMELELEREK